MIAAAIIFWISFLALLHSYVLYPLLLNILSSFHKKQKFNASNDFSRTSGGILNHSVHIIIAAYNEEEVIGEKLQSILENEFPKEKVQIWIGSDASTDRTDEIVREFQARHPFIKLIHYPGRTGKSGIVNDLVGKIKEQNENSILILTDANVIFKKNTIAELLAPFADPQIGLVGAIIENKLQKGEGISFQEKQYIRRENIIKLREGELWGTMMGAFGACYAVRQEYFTQIPPNFLMEDFFITMNVMDKKAKAITNPEAVCYEDVPDKMSEEFARKIRISAGNFQNLFYYKHLLWPPFSRVGFSFWSHKVLRWLGPLFLVLLLISGAVLSRWNEFYEAMFIIQVVIWLIPAIDFLLKKAGVNIIILRFITYFFAMNLALLIGFLKYIKGIKTNVWKPTERNKITS